VQAAPVTALPLAPFEAHDDDALKADELFRIPMGEKVEPRREFIRKNALEVKEVVGGTTVADQTPRVLAPARATAPLVCRLRHRIGRQGPSPTSGEVEIENVSGAPVEIEVSMHLLQYLTLAVTDSRGTPLPAPPYGNIFSPREPRIDTRSCGPCPSR
jgi:hypothetical protein